MEVDVVIIGTGFGASVAVTKLLEKVPHATIHMLERGLWWFTPERPLPQYLVDQNKNDPATQPIQYWPRPNNSKGVIDMLSVVRSNNAFIENTRKFLGDIGTFFTGQKRPQPLYRYNLFKDIDIVTASGVGGGSLIYANVSIEPRGEQGCPAHLSDKGSYRAVQLTDLVWGVSLADGAGEGGCSPSQPRGAQEKTQTR